MKYFCLSLLTIFTFLYGTLQAQVTGDWTDAGAVDSLWNTAGNWSTDPNVPNGATDIANFTGIVNFQNVTIDTPTTINQVNITGGAETVITGGSTLTFGGTDPSITVFDGNLFYIRSEIITPNGSSIGLNVTNGLLSVEDVGLISGSGDITINTTGGAVYFVTPQTYTGITTIQSGTLYSQAGIDTSTLFINLGAEAIVIGDIAGEIQNSGQFQIGGAFGDVEEVINADAYTQDANANLTIGITPDNASEINVTNAALLDGELTLNVTPGIYSADTSYPILTAGTLTGEWSNIIEDNELDFQLVYSTTTARLSPIVTNDSSSVVVSPVPLTHLRGNSSNVGLYMFTDGDFVTSSADLTAVANSLLALPADQFEEGLVRVTPLATGANLVSTFQTDVQMAVVLDRQYQKKVDNVRQHLKKTGTLCYGIPNTGFFIEPIGVFYNQHSTGGSLTTTGQVPFKSYTYGAGLGADVVFDENFVAELGVGYTHSNLNWEQDFGHSNWSSIYLAPFLGWFNDAAFCNAMVMGVVNIYHTDRKIQFTGFERVAQSRYNSYDILIRGNAGIRLFLGRNFWFQPEGTLNNLIVFTSSYVEKGAGSISLDVARNKAYVGQPSFRGRLIKEWLTENFCYAPNLYVGWLANVSNAGNISSRFNGAPNNILFNIQGYNETTNQLVLGGEFFMQKFSRFELKIGFEANILSQLEVYTAKIKWNWVF